MRQLSASNSATWIEAIIMVTLGLQQSATINTAYYNKLSRKTTLTYDTSYI